MYLQNDQAEDELVIHNVKDSTAVTVEKTANMEADDEADTVVGKVTAPGPVPEADPATEADPPLSVKPNPKDRLAGKFAVCTLLHNLASVCVYVCCCLGDHSHNIMSPAVDPQARTVANSMEPLQCVTACIPAAVVY